MVNILAEKKLLGMLQSNAELLELTVDSYKINYLKVGNGKPIILIHGLNIGWGQWYKNITSMAKYFTVYAIDLPGSGGSTKINYDKVNNIENLFYKIVDLFIRKNRLTKVDIIGHSLGGWIALKLAIQNNQYIDKIILVDPMGFSDFIKWNQKIISLRLFARLICRTAMKPTRNNMKNFLKSVMYNDIELDSEFIDYYFESINRDIISHPLMLMSSLSHLFKIRRELVLVDQLDGIKNQIMIIIGDKDPILPLNRVEKQMRIIPCATIKVFKNTGHVPFLEKSIDFNKVVIDYFQT